MNKIQLQQMVGGALQEQFEKSFLRVIENLSDPNTPFKDCRKILVELKLTQNEARDDVNCAIKVSEKLAPQSPMQTSFAVGKNLKTGELYAEEYGKYAQVRGQIGIDEDDESDSSDEPEPLNASVIDLRKTMAN